jgi:hypothetical protein
MSVELCQIATHFDLLSFSLPLLVSGKYKKSSKCVDDAPSSSTYFPFRETRHVWNRASQGRQIELAELLLG